MTYREIKRFTLELINRYSVAGETVSPAYNNQSDLVGRIPNLINAALSQIDLGGCPDRLPENPSDACELDAPYPWIQCACYYAAAHLIREDSEFDYAALMNEFETFRARLPGRVRARYEEVREAYGFGLEAL